ncbi:hypothetical protein ACWV95_20755 [Streptomyces albus]
MSEPIAYAAVWRAVMQAAGYRCQCTGQCGNPHKNSSGRCPREHDQCASKRRGPVHLAAAPADLSQGQRMAAALPPVRYTPGVPTATTPPDGPRPVPPAGSGPARRASSICDLPLLLLEGALSA